MKKFAIMFVVAFGMWMLTHFTFHVFGSKLELFSLPWFFFAMFNGIVSLIVAEEFSK